MNWTKFNALTLEERVYLRWYYRKLRKKNIPRLVCYYFCGLVMERVM